MASNHLYIEVSRVRGVVTISTIIRFTSLQPRARPSFHEIVMRLPIEWDVVDGDVITFKDVL